ncbi:probable E3 ubiquitin-protein ligase HERC4 isoform X2 [Patella vulgata]|uniref:probable E3 ubiquitin-protein ligase HERC4 isoform X2 n=1 Tax=Patella vulgata TaxID=6465 RepID=UPI00217FAE2B|nr:probable E3 ubiquitin-protein ligase HERC4 isoform X2 [Patella vulgata]
MTGILCWGKTDHGQLGVGGVDENLFLPSLLPTLFNSPITDLSCSDKHTLVSLADGKLYSCGNNDHGQLGRNTQCTRLEQVDKIQSQHVLKVEAGLSHSMVLTTAKEVFTWGDNSFGQLGREGIAEDQQKTPKLVKTLAVYSVLQIACGNNHCLVLTSEGLVASWGANNHGQLGCDQNISYRASPKFIECLKGIPVAQIATGGNHSFILSQSGAVFGWGRNSFGQLGVNDERDRPFPTLCKSLRNQKIKYLSCGEDHTAALTQSGGVFTFGAGSYGQLGHCSAQNEVLPKQVMELMGSDVTQIATGRRHTLAFVRSSGRLYAFGLGGTGQLGNGSTDIKSSPFPVQWPFIPQPTVNSMQVDEDKKSVIIKQIFAGGDSNFVIPLNTKVDKEPVDFRVLAVGSQILSLTSAHIKQLCELQSADTIPMELSEELTKIFSNASCLNATFLLSNEQHYGSSSKNHGVDLMSVRNEFNEMSKATNVIIIQRICKCLEHDLIRRLPTSPPDVEALRLYLMLPECHLFDQPKYYSSFIVPLGHSIISLDKAASKVIDLWWSTFPASFFSRVVYIYKQCVEFILQLPATNVLESEKRKHSLIVSMEILKKLNCVNEQNGQIIPYHQFYISILKDKVNVKVDYVSWVQQTNRNPNELHYCNYPFLFDAAAKSMLLHTDAMMQMQSAIDEVARVNFSTLLNRMPIDPINPCLVLFVTREHIVRETLQQLSKHSSADLKKPLKVIFMREEAIDAGGVKKEFFMLLLREVTDTKYGMFRFYEDSSLKWFSPQTFEENDMFHLIGILCGLAIYNFTIINLPFPLALYKKLLKRPVTLDDLKELSPTVAKSLQNVLEFEGDLEETFALTFEITQELFGESETVELCTGGAKKMVNKDNRKEYVDTYINHVFNTSVENQYSAFSSGFLKVCGSRVLELFHPLELQAMVIGNENYDFMEMEKNTEYKDEYHRYHQTIQYFWEVFYDMSLENKKKFLMFLTGSDRISVFGMEQLKMVIQPTSGGEEFLPVAHTCFNLLDLPKYKSKQALKDKLLLAIQHTEGFGIV